MDTYRSMFNCPVGYSDHTMGSSATLASVALGSNMIEKHFKIDNTVDSPDSSISVSFDDFKLMVNQIHEVSKSLKFYPRTFINSSEKAFRDDENKISHLAEKDDNSAYQVELRSIFLCKSRIESEGFRYC